MNAARCTSAWLCSATMSPLRFWCHRIWILRFPYHFWQILHLFVKEDYFHFSVIAYLMWQAHPLLSRSRRLVGHYPWHLTSCYDSSSHSTLSPSVVLQGKGLSYWWQVQGMRLVIAWNPSYTSCSLRDLTFLCPPPPTSVTVIIHTQ